MIHKFGQNFHKADGTKAAGSPPLNTYTRLGFCCCILDSETTVLIQNRGLFLKFWLVLLVFTTMPLMLEMMVQQLV